MRRFDAAKLVFCRASLAIMTAGLLIGIAPAQQPVAEPSPPPVPSIEELKRQLAQKRQQIEENKKQAKPHSPEADSAPASASAPAKTAVPPTPSAAPSVPASPKPASSAPVASALTTTQPAPHAHPDDAKLPPVGKAVPAVRVDPNGGSATDSCPYPDVARNRGDTGTVVLLLYVAQDGRAADTEIEASSGSDILDDAAANCVKEFGRFLPKHVGSRAEAGWFRMRFTWSFGDP
jgi:protein TonB